MPYSINEKCTGCTLCAKICPVRAISGNIKQLHAIKAERCVSCGACGNVCNFGAILNERLEAAVKKPRSEWKKPSIDPKRCSACGICVQLCGKDCLAISLPQFRGDIHVFARLADEKACVDCGLCAAACPLHAITMKGGKTS